MAKPYSIFEKLLWNPNTFGEPKALQRLRLEAVCKRFQELVHNAGCLEWDFNQSEDESAFLRYMLQQRKCASLLTKVALVVEHPVNLAAILQSIILQAQDSLGEIHLFMGGAGAASIIDFEYMLLMFQACKELATLEVLYWTRELQVSQRLLCNDWLPKPFARLRTLTLQGFAVSPLRFDAFIERFPSLTSLELNCLMGATYTLRSSSLRKMFWWGNEAAGIDTENPSRISIPRSLEKVVALLDSRSILIREKAVRVLLALASNAGSRVAVAQAPGCLQRLGVLLQAPSGDLQKIVPGLLWELAADDTAGRFIVHTPDIVPRLAELLVGAPLAAVSWGLCRVWRLSPRREWS
ncbi:hypothetical protein KFL_009400060 [Klebsormidium nitens]|uniref:Uncharacterized protein n=1 Tax=Klebsormidium nitens TaxID=105231 RepID=A0A1Y1IN42_KLENI|nr:hypothetical protein KFL_009400060 [Klebsormidium nitens]|eukprot:GAQ92184.1 hypothetical protein KFL_009400060 [Klebsormidium nitens]